jgi:hypothetical protein
MALGARLSGLSVSWVSAGSDVVALEAEQGMVVEGLNLSEPADGVAADRLGGVWVSSQGLLYSRRAVDDWQVVDLDGPAWRLFAHPGGEGVWVESDGEWFFVGAQQRDHLVGVSALSDAALQPMIDGYGRLALVDSDGLKRLAVRRPVEIVGVSEQDWIERSVWVSLLPTAPAEVTGLSLELIDFDNASTAWPVDTDGAAEVDPLGLRFGGWTLRATATYADHDDGVGELGVQVAAEGGATWAADIAPIYEADCAVCHDGATETELNSPALWEASIDVILDKVIAGDMPLGGTPLTGGEVGLIQAWQAGGFAL